MTNCLNSKAIGMAIAFVMLAMLAIASGLINTVGFKLCPAHFLRVAFVVKQDITTTPIDVALLGAGGVVLERNRITNLIDQPAGSGFQEIQVVFLLCATQIPSGYRERDHLNIY